jgi:6-phosphogluconate dehydrogenase
MKLGMIGLGRMGSNMVRRLLGAGHECVVFDIHPRRARPGQGRRESRPLARRTGLQARDAARDLDHGARRRRRVHARRADAAARPGDAVIDGGNSYYHDDIRRAKTLGKSGIHYVDVGTSGGVWGFDRGYCLMIGGEPAVVKRLDPSSRRSRPASTRRPSRAGTAAGRPPARLHPLRTGRRRTLRQDGAQRDRVRGHGGVRRRAEHSPPRQRREAPSSAADAETAPLRHPELYQYDLNLADIAEAWRHGSVIGSWLLDLTAAALKKSPDLSGFAGRVSDSGEGRWTLKAAIDEGVPAPVLSTALAQRFASRGDEDFANKVLSAMRYEFGGHEEKQEAAPSGRRLRYSAGVMILSPPQEALADELVDAQTA